MRLPVGFCALLLTGACRSKETAPRVVEAGSPPPPAAVVFTDLGDSASLSIGDGLALQFRPVGSALIVIDLTEPPKPTWKQIQIERHVIGRDGSTETDQLETGRWRHDIQTKHAAEPGTTYAYRARLDDRGTWTSEVNVRMSKPKAVPPPPSKVFANADSRFATTIAWDADSRAAAGFEVDVMDGDAKEWSLLAIVNPTEKEFAHNYRLPKMTARYRVATFNANGKSAFVETPPTTMPEKDPKPPPPLKPPPPCLKGESLTPGFDWAREPGHGVSIVAAAPDSEFTLRRIKGYYRGCVRDMGTFEVQGDVMAPRPWADENGYWVIRGVTGAGSFVGAQVRMYALANGRYEEVNVAQFCGDPYPEENRDHRPTFETFIANEVTKSRGPFYTCQRDKLVLDEERP